MKEHVLITVFTGARATMVIAIHVVNIVKIYYRRNIDLPVGLLIVITSQVTILHQQLQSAIKIQLGLPDGFFAFQWAAQIVKIGISTNLISLCTLISHVFSLIRLHCIYWDLDGVAYSIGIW